MDFQQYSYYESDLTYSNVISTSKFIIPNSQMWQKWI